MIAMAPVNTRLQAYVAFTCLALGVIWWIEAIMTSNAPNVPGAAPADTRVFGITIQQKHMTAVFNFARIFSYATTWDKLMLLLSMGAAALSGLSMPLLFLLFGKLTEEFTGFFRQGADETEAVFTTTVNKYVLYIVYIFIGKVCLLYVANLGLRTTSLRISSAIRLAYLRALFQLPISTLDMIPPGQTAAIVTMTANSLQAGISERMGHLCSSLSVVVTGVILSLFFDWALTIVVGLGLVLVVLVYTFATGAVGTKMADIQNIDIQSASVATDALTSIKMLVACGAESKLLDRYSEVVDKTRRIGAQLACLLGLQHGLIYLIINITFAFAFWVALQMYQYQVLGAGGPQSVIVVLLCVMTIASSVGQITGPLTAASQAAEACAIFHTIIDAPKTAYGTAVIGDAGAEDLVLHNVHFTYASRPDVKVLDDLCLRFPAGKVTAIVGPSGSGKSTIVGILQRWYEFNGDPVLNPTVLWFRHGIVAIGKRLLSELDIKWWRNQIGLVQQDNVLFNTTIYKNVEYGLIGTQWEDASDHKKAMMIRSACQDAFADEFISRLPGGYDTMVGQSGLKLSGGQRQRIAIARAIVKQPKILILDEATSAIDVHSEQIVQAALDRASQGRTTIVIAHRLATIRKADNIVVLRGGRVVQQGKHEDLMSQIDGPYHVLATSQTVRTGDGAPPPEKALIEDEAVIALPIEQQLGDVADASYFKEKKEDRRSLWRQEPASNLRDDFSDDGGSERTLLGDTDIEEGTRPIVMQKPGDNRLGSFGTLLYEQRARWIPYSLVALAAVGAGSSTPFQAYLFAKLISLFSLWGSSLSTLTNYWCVIFVYLGVAAGLSHLVLVWSTTSVGFSITRAYRKEYFSNILSKPISFFDDSHQNSTGALASRLAADPFHLQQLLGANMAAMLVSLINVLGCAGISIAFGWKLALAAFGTSMPVIIFATVYRIRHERRLDAMGAVVFAESAAFAAESIAAIRTVSSLTMEDSVCRRLGTRLLASHEYTPFQYILVYNAVVQGALATGAWLSFGPNIAAATAAADRVLAAREDHDDEEFSTFDQSSGSEEYGDDTEKGIALDFRKVWFSYPTRPDVAVLKGLDLQVRKGEIAAIVGSSGSGKTTVISLIERFYRAQSGEVRCNGQLIDNLDLASYRSSLSLVAQEPCLFSGSVRENIMLGVGRQEQNHEADSEMADEGRMHAAARAAGIHDFVVSLPEGYETDIGTAGVALSGGQKQRISIARALVRNPSVLLLDEATSSLDSETERKIQDVFDSERGKRTILMVAHRLATVQNADVIFVMNDGVVVEKGSHASLISQRGLYYQMVSLSRL
ncbi:ABC transporter [Diaporthe helianthi]|uniref:ABC transporter n=1 Tax=Diaporthe helianthi TaxID=158607 RepID=A0A2P5HLD4_DIAHE|nr:ABC transporter [Diaporthe helianthi]